MKGLDAQNFDLYNQMSYQYMHQMAQNMASYGLNKKVSQVELRVCGRRLQLQKFCSVLIFFIIITVF